MTPGSMPLATEIYQEGLRIPPVRLVRGGAMDEDVLELFLANTRVRAERRGDLLAQLAALRLGERRLRELVEREGAGRARAATRALQDYSERLMRANLRQLPDGEYTACDFLDDDGLGTEKIRIVATVRVARGRVRVDFTGSAEQVAGGVNANYAVTLAAVCYVFQAIAESPIPANAGMMRPITVEAPPGTVVNASFPAAVAGGNVETSQRIVDVVLRALSGALPRRIPASSSGTMNNLAFGGLVSGRAFSYYETIAGGAGAGPNGNGASAVHTHMTNTLNTPVEALESDLPVRVVRYAIRRRSGGAGRQRGGDGVVREIEFLAPAQVTLVTERRAIAPPGLRGGQPGTPGRNTRVGGDGKTRKLPGKTSIRVDPGTRIRIETPGGGGYGNAKRR
jgi:N-methylhydantoinase B